MNRRSFLTWTATLLGITGFKSAPSKISSVTTEGLDKEILKWDTDQNVWYLSEDVHKSHRTDTMSWFVLEGHN